MKKITALSCLALLGFSLLSCTPSSVDYYTDDAPLEFALSSEHLKILQITDLHMTYGIGYNDQRTLDLIRAMAKKEEPDIIVITGDMSMSPQGPSLFSQLYRNMERLGIPWTFIFGNHETDSNDYSKYLSLVKTSSTLYFKVG
ncbi:MAG: metallophosphoesterase, partial [Firmicutes bacterium]|nr:metallophosphoesterase [Bacillota bacterium]